MNRKEFRKAVSPLSHEEQLMKIARSVARLETKARGLRQQLKNVTAELRAKRKELKAYAQNIVDIPWNERSPKFGTLGDK